MVGLCFCCNKCELITYNYGLNINPGKCNNCSATNIIPIDAVAKTASQISLMNTIANLK